MGNGENGHLGQMDIWGKGVPKVPYFFVPIFPQFFAKGQWEKWMLGKKDIWRKGVPQVACAHFPQIFANGQWVKWAFGENKHLGEMLNLSDDGTYRTIAYFRDHGINLRFHFSEGSEVSLVVK